MPEDRDPVPSWDGSPGTFESYVTACKWYSKGTKESAAKSIVRYADPEQFDHEDGLNQFLALLRESPLQRLPVPDSFNRSPMSGNRAGEERGRDLGTQTFPSAGPIHSTTTTASGDFFEDELRDYRLLRACRLSGHERQNVLVQTANSTSFHLVRRALRTLYNDETSERQQVGAKRIWWTDSFVGQDWYDEDDIEGPSDDLWWSDWAWSEWHQDDDGSPTYWTGEDWIEDWWQDAWYVEDEDLYPDETSADPEEAQLSEAFAIANEGKSFGVGKGAKGKSSFKGKGYGKGFSGKGSKSSKGKTYFLPGVSAQWDEHTSHGRAPTRAILDTGATENAIGIDALHDLVVHGHFQYTVCKEDLPTFRFGNGHRDQAVSRADLVGTSLGAISFYVLGGMAKATPPLIGARTLRGKHAVLSYQDGRIKFHDGDIDTVQAQQTSRSVQMQALQSGNLTIDLAEAPIYAMERTSTQEAPISISETDRLESQVLMMSTESSEHLPVGSCEQSLDVTSRLQHSGYPCFGDHKEGRQRTNQFATWVSCAKCGLRTLYMSKDKSHGERRSMGPEPHLIRLALEELQQTVPPDHCTEQMVNGKLMEIKGKMLQLGVSQTMAINMTYTDYMKRIEQHGRADGKSVTQITQEHSARITAKAAAKSMATSSNPKEMDAVETRAYLEAENYELRRRAERAEELATEAMPRTELLGQEARRANQEQHRIGQMAEEARQALGSGVITIPSDSEKETVPGSPSALPIQTKKEAVEKKEDGKEGYGTGSGS
ncbi:unnamed protein product [Durusdinium trenchii]|uniref:Peptidase A2 domain-containing protein n=1 Tax=Durusdinium trenchii TaxID=1381693 RepID=A0ABP0HBH4_9DINO